MAPSLFDVIAALKRCMDSDGALRLDRDQTNYLLFLFYEIAEGDGAAMKFAQLDLLGSLPTPESDGRSA